MKKVSIIVCLVVCVCGLTIFSGCTGQESAEGIVQESAEGIVQENSSNGIKVKTISCDYRYYQDEEDLINNTELIIIGEVIKVNEPEEIVIGVQTKNPDASIIVNNDDYKAEFDLSFVYTVSEIKVTKVLKGNCNIGDIVEVKQMGDGNIIVDDVEYYKQNSSQIFFLATYPERNIPASVKNPIQGQIDITGNKIMKNSQNKLFGDANSVEDIVKEIENITKFETE